MKKLNNKGLTITELLVSVALMSVVMLFLYRMLADVTFQKDNDFFASNNQEQRIEMIDKIERLVNGEGMTVSGYSVNSNKIIINGAPGNIEIEINTVDNKTLKVKSGGALKYHWELKGAKFASKNVINCEPTEFDDVFHKTVVECQIRVATSNTNNDIKDIGGKTVNNNNTLDDIEFSFMY